MKKIENLEIIGSGRGQDYMSGVLCGIGLITSTTGFGIMLAIGGCGVLIGNW
jgi:hypothetical protein